jgi:ElaB/YqjD/DUF883 family membrane-anchored ribosome-binding protein
MSPDSPFPTSGTASVESSGAAAAASAVAPTLERVRAGMNTAVDSVERSLEVAAGSADQWLASCRDAVRQRPLASVGVAFAIGYLMAQLAARR